MIYIEYVRIYRLSPTSPISVRYKVTIRSLLRLFPDLRESHNLLLIQENMHIKISELTFLYFPHNEGTV